jgi:hypothetical protein
MPRKKKEQSGRSASQESEKPTTSSQTDGLFAEDNSIPEAEMIAAAAQAEMTPPKRERGDSTSKTTKPEKSSDLSTVVPESTQPTGEDSGAVEAVSILSVDVPVVELLGLAREYFIEQRGAAIKERAMVIAGLATAIVSNIDSYQKALIKHSFSPTCDVISLTLEKRIEADA